MTEKTTQDLINLAAAGEETPVPVEIYWDEQDPENAGPAYRIGEPGSGHQETGEMEFAGWSTNDEDSMGYVLDAYFDGDGRYLGPDGDGVHPQFWCDGTPEFAVARVALGEVGR